MGQAQRKLIVRSVESESSKGNIFINTEPFVAKTLKHSEEVFHETQLPLESKVLE